MQLSPIRVRPLIVVNGSIVVSWPICTSTSITVVLRVDDAHAGQHVALVDRPLRQLAHARQRNAVVYAEHQRRVDQRVRSDRLTV